MSGRASPARDAASAAAEPAGDPAGSLATGSALLLALDTATEVASWALGRGETLLAEQAAEPGRATAEVLLPTLDQLLDGAGIALDEIDGFAVSIGPGSFTGLRVGVATVKGLAFEPARPAAGIPTLAALALHAEHAGPVAALLDARRGEVYAAGFEIDRAGGVAPADWLPERVVPVAALAACLPAGCRVVGEGVSVCGEALSGTDALVMAPPYPATTARHVAVLGARHPARGDFGPAGSLTPRYLRRAEAEVKRTGERFE